MKICVIGTGYVGLVTGTCFAETGNDVICVDIDENKIKKLENGEIPIFEPGLDKLVLHNVKENRLKFSTNLEEAINFADLSFIAVGTPPKEDGSADLSHVLKVAEDVAQVAKKDVVLGTKSTVPVGTGDKVEALLKDKCKFKSTVFSNPEFLKEGDAVNDFLKPDRVVVGLNDDSLRSLFEELYAPFTRQRERLIFMSRKSAELTKYAANAMLATRISFMNEIANLCEKVGADVKDIRAGIGSDPRIGSAFLYPGMGYGGSCFPKDVKAILRTGKEFDSKLQVIQAVDDANDYQKTVLFQKIVNHYGGKEKLKDLTFAVWGLAFKANTDDTRESPALALIDQLIPTGCKLNVFDPEAMPNVKADYGDQLNYFEHNYDCLENADALIIATEWNEFRNPDFGKIKSGLKSPTIFDGRNLLNIKQLEKNGFEFFRI